MEPIRFNHLCILALTKDLHSVYANLQAINVTLSLINVHLTKFWSIIGVLYTMFCLINEFCCLIRLTSDFIPLLGRYKGMARDVGGKKKATYRKVS